MVDDSAKDQRKKSYWKRLDHWWKNKGEAEQKRIKSFIPLSLYTVAVVYGVIYLSILNTVNRGKGMDAIKTWYGGDRSEIVRALNKEKDYLENSFKKMIRKRVSGGR
ncbi:MAG: hypothetical protein ACKVK9_05185 [Nitrospinaceae bacterium]